MDESDSSLDDDEEESEEPDDDAEPGLESGSLAAIGVCVVL